MRSCILHSALFLMMTALSVGQTWPDSPVFRDYRPQSEDSRRQRAYSQQLNMFLLERDANRGDPLAQHELGARYLTGRGIAADTVKSAAWLKRAADHQFTPALYNYALLLANGWGVEWNPYQAFSLFLRAAEQGMPEAQLAVGIFYTDDLVLKQDWNTAYRWMLLAADNGLEAASRAAEEIERRGHVKKAPATADAGSEQPAFTSPASRSEQHIISSIDTLSDQQKSIFPYDTSAIRQGGVSGSDSQAKDNENLLSSEGDVNPDDEWTPQLLDFSPDTTRRGNTTERLLRDFIESTELSTEDSAAVAMLTGTLPPASATLMLLTSQARSCNPEAMVLLGRLHEEGLNMPLDHGAAAVWYLRASWHESPQALPALGRLLSTAHSPETFLREAYAGNANAQYVTAALHALEVERRLSPHQALEMLKRAIDSGSSDAIVQLGLWYSGGRLVQRDMTAALAMWRQAASLRNEEARIRLAAASVLGEDAQFPIASALPILEFASKQGSLLAATALARSYEAGIGRSPNKGIAARMYREAAIRGSRSAYAALRRMHDDSRRTSGD